MVYIGRTLKLLAECVGRAEMETAARVDSTHRGASEPLLTDLFCDTLKRELRAATEDGRLAAAFVADVEHAFPHIGLDRDAVRASAEHLFMDCEKHHSHAERISGGDFGLAISRPVFHGILITTEEQGLLCQAKLKSGVRSWGKLTKNQQKVLPDNLDYTCLVLYEYRDQARRQLAPIKWHLCKGETITAVSDRLRKGNFPSLASTADVIEKLGSGVIGTSDRETIEKVIARKNRPILKIRIDWPEGGRPRDVHELVRMAQPVPQYAHVRG